MPALLELLRKQSETNRVASYFNIDILKYQVDILLVDCLTLSRAVTLFALLPWKELRVGI